MKPTENVPACSLLAHPPFLFLALARSRPPRRRTLSLSSLVSQSLRLDALTSSSWISILFADTPRCCLISPLCCLTLVTASDAFCSAALVYKPHPSPSLPSFLPSPQLLTTHRTQPNSKHNNTSFLIPTRTNLQPTTCLTMNRTSSAATRLTSPTKVNHPISITFLTPEC